MQPTPTNIQLLKSTLIAAVLAIFALIFFILPAEYNIDPTGIGSKLGLTQLAESKPQAKSTNQPSAIVATPSFVVAPSLPVATKKETIEVKVPSGKGIEYKITMAQYAKVTYQWTTDGEPLYFDMHGEPAGDTTGYFESYAKATLSQIKGSFTAPFNGSHGWYWKNKTDRTINVTLTVEGQYSNKP